MAINTFHPHVWFKNSEDVFRNNVIFRNYAAIGMPRNDHWGKEIDYNIFMVQAALAKAQTGGRDTHSVYPEPLFVDPGKGDFRLKKGFPAFVTGFKNFDMDNFGVVSPSLKAVAQKVVLPQVILNPGPSADQIINYLGLKLKNLNTLGERSAKGMAAMTGCKVSQPSF